MSNILLDSDVPYKVLTHLSPIMVWTNPPCPPPPPCHPCQFSTTNVTRSHSCCPCFHSLLVNTCRLIDMHNWTRIVLSPPHCSTPPSLPYSTSPSSLSGDVADLSASWRAVWYWLYFFLTCSMYSSSSFSRIFRKLSNSGTVKASHYGAKMNETRMVMRSKTIITRNFRLYGLEEKGPISLVANMCPNTCSVLLLTIYASKSVQALTASGVDFAERKREPLS